MIKLTGKAGGQLQKKNDEEGCNSFLETPIPTSTTIQSQLQGALYLKRKGTLKRDLRKTRVVQATPVGPVTQNRRRRKSATVDFSKKREKISFVVSILLNK